MNGSCLCGAIRFEVDGPNPMLYQCHCSLCRKQGGSVSNTGLIIAADKFRWLAGEPLVSTWENRDGIPIVFLFALRVADAQSTAGHRLHLGAQRTAGW
jgi:hypothetical protein